MNVRQSPPLRSARQRRSRPSAALRQGGVAVIRESTVRLRVRGELDLASAALLAGHLADGAIEELDVSGVSFIDAAGLAPLLAARTAAPQHVLRLVTPSSAVTRILELSGEVGAFAVWP